MPTVGQIRMQAAASDVNSATSKPGSMPGGSAMPAGFEAFAAALDRSSMTRLEARAGSDRVSSQPMPLAFSRQNLPRMGSQAEDPAKITDAMQLLMAQLAAQGLLNTALQTPNPAVPQVNSAETDSAARIQSLMASLNAQAGSPDTQGLMQLVNGQQLDAKQSALITQALSRAMKASGQSAEIAMQSQAASLMQALQQQSLGQTTAQTPAQIASAIQSLAQKNGITLPPEIQTQLTALMNKAADLGSIKLLAAEGAGQQKPIAVLEQAGVVDPAKAATIQNATDPKAANALISAGEKAVKAKSSDAILTPGQSGDKAAAAKGAPLLSASAVDAKGAIEAHSISLNENREFKDTLDTGEFNPANAANLARVDAQNISNQQKIEMKAAEVSLATGPLHEQVMNAAKSGGGRILLELTPPEQGTIRIDLRIDPAGRAHLIVEGASDATKSRLDQGGQSLKNEFAQMGLNLSLDLRQDSQFQQAREQGFSNPRSGFYNSPPPLSQRSDTTLAIGSVRSGDNRDNSNAVHLYA
ncbi:flagellar hook-length control protein FliK [Polynucleobacter difficilis]|uniref:flagellar hook-length control protein FliK n=1 Tax=Polynucleobacter difficilis TaxID=556054 RepID=UPI000D393F87|nr:flagellar hook-length control protein FliK [Polynucleobacter difficilis]